LAPVGLILHKMRVGARQVRTAATAAGMALACAACEFSAPIDGPPSAATAAVSDGFYVRTNEPAVVGRKQFERGNYGLSARYFREAVEKVPHDLDSWLGLAASYDNLKRFDLADRAYDQALRLGGRQITILNNLGYSYVLRGDPRLANAMFQEVLSLDPGNEVVLNNIKLLHGAYKPPLSPR
jgi:Flp pilus assembly protein TadD